MLYNGDEPWTPATNISELIPKVPGLVAQFLSSLQYLLIAENQYTEVGLAQMQNLAAAMMRLQRPPEQGMVLEVIDLLNAWLDGNPELKRIVAIWIRAVLLRQSNNALALPKVQDLKELKMTLATRFEEWAHQYKDEGRQEGEARILQRLLVARFGPRSQETQAALSTASTAQLEAWTDRFLSAHTLAEVFAAPTSPSA